MKKPITIAIADQQTRLPIDRRWFRNLIGFVCGEEHIKQAKISIAFLDNPTIHQLNKRFLEHDYPTDVLTFPLGSGGTLEGEIVLSTDYAAEECEEYGWPAFMEASLYVIHGMLHLIGYDDNDEQASQAMNRRQQQLLEAFAAMHEPYSPLVAPKPGEVLE